MISFVRGPGGPLRRLAAEWIPASTGVVVGCLAMTFVTPLTAALIGAAAWPLASALLRAVRRRPRLRRAYRLALLAHVIFWSVQGVLATERVPAAEPVLTGVHAWTDPATLHVGFAAAPFDLPAGTTLAGWGSRPRRIRMPAFAGAGVLGRASQSFMAATGDDGQPRLPLFHAPTGAPAESDLGAKAVVLRFGAKGAPRSRAVIVRLDLVTSDAGLHAAILERVTDLGVKAPELLVCATHTHSGPGGYSRDPVSALLGTDHFHPAVFQAVVESAVVAIRNADRTAGEAELRFAPARDRDPATGKPILARNRRAGRPHAVDDRVGMLDFVAVGKDARGSIAVLLNYGIHPHTYRRRSMTLQRDLAGGIEDALAARLGLQRPGPLGQAGDTERGTLFVNGAQGDVSTQSGPTQPKARIEALSSRFADVMFDALSENAAAEGSQVQLACARVQRRLGTPRVIHAASGSRAGALAAVDRPMLDFDAAGTTADVLALPINIAIWNLFIPEVRFGFTWEGDAAVSAGLEPALGNPAQSFTAWVFDVRDPAAERGQRFAILAQPGEATQALGRAWRDGAAERGIDHVMVFGLTNGSCAYLTPASEYMRDGYEAEATVFGPTTGDDATEALMLALDKALEALPPR